MAVKRVQVANVGEVVLYKRRNSRSMRLSVTPTGEVRVSIPYWVPYKSGAIFAASRASWIETMRDNRQNPILQNGQGIGKAHHIYFHQTTVSRVTTRLHEQAIHVGVPKSMSVEQPVVQHAAKRACIKALRKEAETLLPQRLHALAVQGGFTYKNMRIKQLKSRWGSCSSHQEITLNLFLMQLPWHLIDYVLWHELVHTTIMRHGPPFWKALEAHIPHARALSKEIHTHQPVLQPQITERGAR